MGIERNKERIRIHPAESRKVLAPSLIEQLPVHSRNFAPVCMVQLERRRDRDDRP